MHVCIDIDIDIYMCERECVSGVDSGCGSTVRGDSPPGLPALLATITNLLAATPEKGMASVVRPQTLLRALFEHAERALLYGRQPPGPSLSGKAGVLRQQLARAHHDALPRPSTSCRGASKRQQQQQQSEHWRALRAAVDDAFGLVFRGALRESKGWQSAHQEVRNTLSRRQFSSSTFAQRGASGFGRQAAARQAHPFHAPRIACNVSRPVHETGLQSARQFSGGNVSELIFQIPLAARAAADRLEDELSKPGTYKAKARHASPRMQQSTRRSGKHVMSPSSLASASARASSARPTAQTKPSSVQPTEVCSAVQSSATSSAVQESASCNVASTSAASLREEFDYYFASPPSMSDEDETVEVVSTLRIPLDPDLVTIWAGPEGNALEQSTSGQSRLRIFDASFFAQQQQIETEYNYHALKYIVPLERALSTASWRRYLPRDWDMSILVESAFEGVRRGDHCLEIRFVGTSAAVIEDLLFETMGYDRGRWYSSFLSEELVGDDGTDALQQLEEPPSSLSAASVVSGAAPTASRTSSTGHDVGHDIAAMGAASMVSFDDYGPHEAAAEEHDMMASALAFPTLRMPGHASVASESELAAALLRRFS